MSRKKKASKDEGSGTVTAAAAHPTEQAALAIGHTTTELPNLTAGSDSAKPRTQGVSQTRTRPYLAGCIIKRRGISAGITKEMIAELDNAYGKANPRESEFCLRNAWHAVRGYGSEQ